MQQPGAEGQGAGQSLEGQERGAWYSASEYSLLRITLLAEEWHRVIELD